MKAAADKVVWANQILPFRDMFSGDCKPARLPDTLNGDNVRFYHNGRIALWHGIQAMQFPAGTHIAVPSFHCGTELDALAHLRIEPRFYEINTDLTINLPSLEAAIDSQTRAIVVTHDFGLLRDLGTIRSLCDDHGLYLIEDCAHCFTGQRAGIKPGETGDIAIFSMRKLLPIPNGGALRINAVELPLPPLPKPPPYQVTRHYLQRDLGRGLACMFNIHTNRIGQRIVSLLYPGITKFTDPDDYLRARSSEWHGLNAAQLGWGIAPLSLRLLERCDTTVLTTRRQDNFLALAAHLAEADTVRPLFRELPDGACPLAFPVYVNRPHSIMRHLLRHGIEIGQFWQGTHPNFPAILFPNGASLQNHLLALPVHQQLDTAAMWRIASVLASVDKHSTG